ncbi:MAG: 50S ribosomal protein L35ae [Candidatus ainarchaeum sp.]|nr:50S ribosomal protein L35ae [Candidatus ainarchaeum sp.]
MEGILKNYRRGVNTAHPKQFIIAVEGVTTRAKASALAGKKAVWKSKSFESIGKVLSAHGNKGAVRAKFDNGLPGQAIGTKVEIK